MASSVDGIHASGPVKTATSMIAVASAKGESFLQRQRGNVGRAVSIPLDNGTSIPPRGDWFRFGHVQCAAVKLEHLLNKKCPHGSPLRLGKLHMRARFAASSASFVGCLRFFP